MIWAATSKNSLVLLDKMHHSTPIMYSPKKELEKRETSIRARSYEQPTIASKSRSPSPYTKRRMCELSEDTRQRLAHFNLGPFEFKKETDTKPPFVVRHIEKNLSPDSSLLSCSPKERLSESWSKYYEDPSLLGSYKPKHSEILPKSPRDALDSSFDSFDERLIARPAGRQFHPARLLMTHSAPSSAQKDSQSPVLNRSSLRERFHSDLSRSSNWEEIHERIKKILRTNASPKRLTFDKHVLEKEDLKSTEETAHSSKTDKETSHRCSMYNRKSCDRSVFKYNPSVHLDNGEYWSNHAAKYKGKSHRAIFEDSLEKIYRNMYRNASEANIRRKSLHVT